MCAACREWSRSEGQQIIGSVSSRGEVPNHGTQVRNGSFITMGGGGGVKYANEAGNSR